MKKARKILFFTFIGTILLGIILGIILGGVSNIAGSIGSFVGGIASGYNDFVFDADKGTQTLLYSMFAAFFLITAFIFAVQVRRKKSKAFPVYTALGLLFVLLMIFASKNAVDYLKNGSVANKVIGTGVIVVLALELVSLIILSVPSSFEHSELAANAKKSDAYKLADIIVGAVMLGLFIIDLFIISGGKFKVISHFFAHMSVPVVVLLIVQLFLYGYLGYRLVKQKKPVAAVLFPITVLLVEFVGYAYNYYGWVIRFNTINFLASGNFSEVFQGLFVFLAFFLIIIYGMYIFSDYILTIFEARRQKLYNHREKYVYGDRRKFGDSIVKEWEASKNAQATGTSFADIAAAIEAQKAADLRESQGLQGIIVNEDDITNNDEVQASLQAEQLLGEDKVSEAEALEDDSDDKKTTLTLVGGQEPTEFREKLMTLDANKRGRYNKIRNRLQSYKKIKQKFSKTVDTYRYAGELVAKMSIIGSTLRLHLALDPDSYDVNKYHQIDLSAKQKYIFVPFTLKLKGPKSVELAIQLIDELMKGFEIPQSKGYVDQDYAKQVAEELKAEGLLVETPVEGTATEEVAQEKASVEEPKATEAKEAAEASTEDVAPAKEEAAPAEETPSEEPKAEETPADVSTKAEAQVEIETPATEEAAPAEESKEEAPKKKATAKKTTSKAKAADSKEETPKKKTTKKKAE